MCLSNARSAQRPNSLGSFGLGWHFRPVPDSFSVADGTPSVEPQRQTVRSSPRLPMQPRGAGISLGSGFLGGPGRASRVLEARLPDFPRVAKKPQAVVVGSAGGGIRTRKGLLPGDFKSPAFTCFATPAYETNQRCLAFGSKALEQEALASSTLQD